MTTSLGAGGAEKQIVYLANHLAAEFQVEVSILNSDTFRRSELDSRVVFSTAEVDGSKFKKTNVFALLQTLKYLRKSKAHLVITFSYHAMLMVWLSGLWPRATLTPLIVSERSDETGSIARRIFRFLAYRRASVITANSQSAIGAIRKFPFSAGEKLRFTPNYLALTKERRSSIKSNELFTWVCVARLSKEKNHLLLLSSIKLLTDDGWNLRLRLVGDGPLRIQIEENINELGLNAVVEVMGIRSDISQILDAADAFVLSSNFEGTSNAALEACLANLPIAATNAGDIRALVSQENQPFIASLADPSALAAVMNNVMKLSDSELASLGLCNKIHVEEMFCNEGNLSVWNEIIEDTIACRR